MKSCIQLLILVSAALTLSGVPSRASRPVGGESRPLQDSAAALKWKDYWQVEKRIQHGWKDAPMESIHLEGKRQDSTTRALISG